MPISDTKSCPLCGATCPAKPLPDSHRLFRFECDNCGTFATIEHVLETAKKEAVAPRIAAVVRERSLQYGPVLLYETSLTSDIPNVAGYSPLSLEAAEADFPKQTAERLDRALLSLARMSGTLGEPVQFPLMRLAPLFALTPVEADFIARALKDAGHLTPESTIKSSSIYCVVSPAGWNRVAELQSGRNRSPRNPVFVAMAFGAVGDDEPAEFMQQVFETIRRAVERAGYKATRVDLEPHNDFIMDKIMGMIRAAPFVIADFTGNRAGVYFEAGFARGLGIPVVHTCRKGRHFNEAHFDIKQINTIDWNDPADLENRLHHRILGTLGDGPYSSKAQDAPTDK
ncbi:hypothetical protein RAS1_33360 [Phycisphaerae bacterium RAS1]|nr:hypothetical protein RAS1_33360 [Phycisphaerae bacterium RAS1]